MRRSIALALFLSLTALGAVASAQDFDAPGEARMLDAINALRAENQLAPLIRLDTLDAVARGHAAEMAASARLAHVSPTTGTPEDRVRGAGVEASRIAENVANHRDTAGANDALFASAPHRANIVDSNMTHIGLGSVRTERGAYVTQVFAGGIPAPEEAAPPPPPEPTLEADDDESRFALIPPFVERIAEQVAAPVLAQAESLAQAVTAPVTAPTATTPDRAAGSVPATDSASAPTTAPEISAPAVAPDAPSAGISAGAADTLRELIGLGLAILGGGTR